MQRLLTILILFSALSLNAQTFTKIEGEAKKQLTGKIATASQKLQTLKCAFIQEKQLSYLQDIDKSNGTIYFQNPSNLRWEYITPESYYFVFSQNKIVVKNSDGTTNSNAVSNRAFKMLSELIIGFVSSKGLEDNPNFTMEYYTNTNRIMVKMLPESKEMKKILKEVVLYLDSKTFLASEIVIGENTGDTTRFLFSNIETNSLLDKKLFLITQ